MCCPLIFYRNGTMNRAEGSNKMPRFTKERIKRCHHKRIRNKKVQHRRQDALEQLKM
jgi:hypothetical protein